MRSRGSFFQRRYYRVPFSDPVEFVILKYNLRYITHLSGKRGPGIGHDLGEDGLSFISPYLLPVGMILRLDFDLPGFGHQRVLANVVRCVPTDEGCLSAVQFLNLHGSRKEKIRNYITAETKKNFKFLKYL